jgi:hypothetical protein
VIVIGEDIPEPEGQYGEVGEYVDEVEVGEATETSYVGSLSLCAPRKLSLSAAKVVVSPALIQPWVRIEGYWEIERMSKHTLRHVGRLVLS